MKINRLQVFGLFDRFDHDLEFKPDERILIMIGPNGFGKTMTLRLIDTLFTQPVRSLARIPFRKVVVSFDDGSHLKVWRGVGDTNQSQKGEQIKLKLTFPNAAGDEEAIEEVIPMRDQGDSSSGRNRRTGGGLAANILELLGDSLPRTDAELEPENPAWLQAIQTAIPVRSIDTERLTHPLSQRKRSARLMEDNNLVINERTVCRYSEELGKRVQETLTKYGALSQSLDRTFPVRLVEEPTQPNLTMDALREALEEIEAKRARLVEAGLLAQEQEDLAIPVLDKVDESRRGVLAVYARDTKKKLSVFDDLLAKVDTLIQIANARLLYKRITVGPDGLSVVTSDGAHLELDMLSSGEQHELVMLYDLLFRVPDNALILIDEPELSLHVVWQEQFLHDLEEMAKLSKFWVILATHSPHIINDRWDLTVELKGPHGA